MSNRPRAPEARALRGKDTKGRRKTCLYLADERIVPARPCSLLCLLIIVALAYLYPSSRELFSTVQQPVQARLFSLSVSRLAGVVPAGQSPTHCVGSPADVLFGVSKAAWRTENGRTARYFPRKWEREQIGLRHMSRTCDGNSHGD